MGKETIACTNGIAKKAKNIMKAALHTYIKHLGGRIPKIMKSLYSVCYLPSVARRNKLENGQHTLQNLGKMLKIDKQ
ncbi:hypothetical protein WIW89_09810 [Stygiolobus sp. CP850M]|uniref:hypothetical protein n=1 Tax=Stygiolobus sp. CP850M TaxID=3133134 RepID=UPI00307E0A1E